MMKFLMMVFSLFILNMFDVYVVQMFMQIMFFMMFFILLVMFPLNSMNYWMKIYYNMGMDFYSMGLILLTSWILGLMVMMSMLNLYTLNYKYYLNVIMFLMVFLIICFVSMNLILFYLFFESSLIPVFMLIMGWGFQVERIQAGFYMMLYTLAGSLPLFFMIFILYEMTQTLMFNLLWVEDEMSTYMYIMLNFAFLVKMPMYLLHLWLPKAHVEAPLTGSMILAGVMLKLGSYGLMRFMLMTMQMYLKFNKFIIVISLMGGVYSGLICLCQLDMKMLVAYSSVVHMSMLMAGMMTMFSWGFTGGMLMMIAHGLCSSGLFCLVNINYERLNSRSLMLNKGLINIFPALSLMWFFLCSCNLSIPPSLNLFSEIMLMSSLILWSKGLILIISLILFLSASYSLYLYSYSQHGSMNKFIYFMKGINVNEYLTLMLHWLPLNLLFMFMFVYS